MNYSHFFYLIILLWSPLSAMDSTKKAKYDNVDDYLAHFEQTLINQQETENDLVKLSHDESFRRTKLEMKDLINRIQMEKKAFKERFIEKDNRPAFESELTKELHATLTSHLTSAFDGESELYSRKQKEWLLFQGIKTKLLNEYYNDDESTIHHIASGDHLSQRIKPLLSAIKLQSIRSILELDKKFTNLMIYQCYNVCSFWSPGRLAKNIIINNEERNVDARIAKSILLILKAINGSIDIKDCYHIPLPRCIFQRPSTEVSSLKMLCCHKVLSVLSAASSVPDNLTDFKKKFSLDILPQELKGLLFTLFYSTINCFDPELLKQLSLKESSALNQFWQYHLEDLCREAQAPDADINLKMIRQLLAKYGYLDDEGNFNSGASMQLWQELTKELGLYKKKPKDPKA